MLCSACGTPVPRAASECPRCGMATQGDLSHTDIFGDQESASAGEPDNNTPLFEVPSWSKSFMVTDPAASRRADLTVGTVFGGRYEILKMVGEGGMGSVYKARDIEVERFVALKVVRQELAQNAEIIPRFRQELILTRQITSRNVVRIHDLGQADGVRFITMEYIEGLDLGEVLAKRGTLPPKEAAEIMLQVCRD